MAPSFMSTPRPFMVIAACFALSATWASANDILLIPNSAADTVMAFDPNDGSLLDAAFIPDPGSVGGLDVFRRPLHAIDSGRETILVSDQFTDAVLEFDFNGNYLGVFSNGGVIDTNVLDNVRGIAMRPNGELLVCNNGRTSGIIEANRQSVVPFDASGNQPGSFIFQRYGGIDGPFCVLVLPEMILVSSDGRDHIARYTPAGKFDDIFARDPAIDFPQQMALSRQNTILVAVFSGGYILEYTLEGTLTGVISPLGLSGFRGVAELENGNLLVTTGTGAHEVTRSGLVIGTEFSGSELRYIERVTLPAGRSKPTVRARAAQRVTNSLDHGLPPPAGHSADDERGLSANPDVPAQETAGERKGGAR